MWSWLYPYNSNFIHNPKRYFESGYQKKMIDKRGFVAQHKKFDELKAVKKDNKKNDKVDIEVDSVKIRFLEDFIAAIDTSTIFIAVLSPSCDGLPKEKVELVESFVERHNIPLWDFSNEPKYFHHDEYFYNPAHLNAKGADEFTKDVINRFRQVYK